MSREEPLASAAGPGRQLCYRCFRPAALCLCPSIPRVENKTPIVILQHPRERTHPFGTARLSELGLCQVRVLVDYDSRLRRQPEALALPHGAGLLYPQANARDITTLRPGERPTSLVVIDGTWHHARTLYRDMPALQALPHFTLPSHHRSAFAIRRQPHEHCLSTLEAIVFALQALEPHTAGLSALLEAFRGMVQTQLELSLTHHVGREHRPRRARASRAIPRALIEDFERLVIAYGESLPDPQAPRGRRLLSCAAERPATGERLYCLLKASGANAVALGHMGLCPSAVAGGISHGEFRDTWARFVRPGDVLGAWNQSTLDLLRSLCERPERSALLKAAYLNLGRRRGGLDEIVVAEGLASQALGLQPRAFQRLGNAVALARLLHALGVGSVAAGETVRR